MFRLGQILTAVCGGVLWLFFIGMLMEWMGSILGFFLGILFSPGVVIFPVIYWLVEGVWPGSGYFLLFGLAWLGIILSYAGGRLSEKT